MPAGHEQTHSQQQSKPDHQTCHVPLMCSSSVHCNADHCMLHTKFDMHSTLQDLTSGNAVAALASALRQCLTELCRIVLQCLQQYTCSRARAVAAADATTGTVFV